MIGMAWVFALCSEIHVASAQIPEQKKEAAKMPIEHSGQITT